MLDETRFFETLLIIEDRSRIGDAGLYASLPDSWHVTVAKIEAPLDLINQGRYRELHTVTAASVVAVLNETGRPSLPFSAGGDGAVMCVPKELLWEARQALAGVRQLAKHRFGLSMKVGSVSMSDLRKCGQEILVARYRASPKLLQAAFLGGGLAYAEKMISEHHPAADIPDDSRQKLEPDLGGLECRWRDLRSRKEETVCLIVQPRTLNSAESAALLSEVSRTIRSIYGGDAESRPVARENLKLSLARRDLLKEVLLKEGNEKSFLGRELRLLRLRAIVTLGMVLMRFRARGKGVHWDSYKEDLIQNADVMRMVQGLRQVLSGSRAQRMKLEQSLEQLRASGKAWYGIHVSDVLHMTCMVFNRSAEHYHFLDGADGGFVMAAEKIRQQISEETP